MECLKMRIYNFNMKGLITIILLTVIAFGAKGQSKEALEKIESARIALITERLNLSPEEAEKFWPLYREYSEKRKILRQEFIEAKREVKAEGMTEQESKRLLDKGLELRERQLEIDKTYSERLTRVISTQQLLQLKKAEDDFRKMLLERLDQRREQRERINNRRQRQDNDN